MAPWGAPEQVVSKQVKGSGYALERSPQEQSRENIRAAKPSRAFRAIWEANIHGKGWGREKWRVRKRSRLLPEQLGTVVTSM